MNYFKNKLDKWIPYFVQEAVYVLYGDYISDPKLAFKNLFEHEPQTKWFKLNMGFYKRTMFLDELENILYSALRNHIDLVQKSYQEMVWNMMEMLFLMVKL